MSDTKVIYPTVGRKLYYVPATHAAFNVISEDQPLDATVLYVHDEHHVNLWIIDHRGNCQFRDGVYLVQPGEPEPKGAFAKWMPFQVGQAPDALRDRVKELEEAVAEMKRLFGANRA